jgi:hypothetical protein
METIAPGVIATPEMKARIEAALKLRRTTLQGFATETGKSYNVMQQMLRGERKITGPYAKLFNDLVRKHLIQPVRAMRMAA